MMTLVRWWGASGLGRGTAIDCPTATASTGLPCTWTRTILASPVISGTRLNVKAVTAPSVVLVTCAVLVTVIDPRTQWMSAATSYVARRGRLLGAVAATLGPAESRPMIPRSSPTTALVDRRGHVGASPTPP